MSKIEWTDETWNPVTGCTRVSAGCDNCYAANMSKRLAAMGQEKYQGLTGNGHFNGKIKLHEDALNLPLTWRKPRMVFVNSMSDLFHKNVPFEFIDKVFAVMALCPQHTFQILTKRPERMAEYLSQDREEQVQAETQKRLINSDARVMDSVNAKNLSDYGEGGVGEYWEWDWHWPLPGVWLGTSVEDQQAAGERIPHLLKCPAAVRFLSCEPLLGSVDLTQIALEIPKPIKQLCVLPGSIEWAKKNGIEPYREIEPGLKPVHGYPKSLDVLSGHVEHENGVCFPATSVHWVIVGGESGHNARKFDVEWARSIVSECRNANVPCFVKQLGARPYDSTFQVGELRHVPDKIDGRHNRIILNSMKGGDPDEWPEDLRVREWPARIAKAVREAANGY